MLSEKIINNKESGGYLRST